MLAQKKNRAIDALLFNFDMKTLSVSGSFIGNPVDGYGGNILVKAKATKQIIRLNKNFYAGERFDHEIIQATLQTAHDYGHTDYQYAVE